jgi:hypothetical protein
LSCSGFLQLFPVFSYFAGSVDRCGCRFFITVFVRQM